MCSDSAHIIVCKIGRRVYNWTNIVFSPSSDNGPQTFLILHIAFVKAEEREKMVESVLNSSGMNGEISNIFIFTWYIQNH